MKRHLRMLAIMQLALLGWPAHSSPESVKVEKTWQAAASDAECVVTVYRVLESREYRGAGPMTPALEDNLSRDPELVDSYRSESHGDYHIQCHYEVGFSDRPRERFLWREVHPNTLRELDISVCAGRAAQVAEKILSTTRNCTDLDAGEYWGMRLVPLRETANP